MTVEEIPAGLSAFLAAVRARDATSAAAQLAEYVILESPIDAEPVVGRQQVAKVVSQLLDVFDEFTITQIISGDGHFAVVTNIRIGTAEIDGIDLIGINAEGKVASLSVHLRPLRAIVALQNRLAPASGMPALTLTEEHQETDVVLESAAPLDIKSHLAPVPAETDAEVAARFVRDVIPLLDTLLGGAMRMTRQRADAEDLVQETMVRAFAGFRTFQQGTNLTRWLFTIQANTHISGYRKRMRRPAELPIDTIYDWQLMADAERSPRALRSAEVEALELLPDDDIRIALDALPVTFRMAVFYADVAGFAYKEISSIMCTPLGTVMSRLHRGRSQLRVLLAALAADRGYARVQQQRGSYSMARRRHLHVPGIGDPAGRDTKQPSRHLQDTNIVNRRGPSKAVAVSSNNHVTRLPLYAMAVGAAVAAFFICATPGQANGDQTAFSITGCADVEVVFARGTFEGPGVGKVGEPFIEALRQRLLDRTVGVHAVNYPASLQFNRAVDGILDATNRLRDLTANCPTTEIIVGGYSQGAAVSGYAISETVPAGYALTALPPNVAENITAVVLFGKPSPDILRLLQHDAPPIDIGPTFHDRTIDLCAPRDPVCESGGLDRGAHSAYAVNGMAEEAAEFVVDRLRSR
jgi:RNA polymerase sigma-70 factor (TIGR02947 family)